MARTGWSTSNFFRCTSAVVTAYPLTIAAWFNTPTATGGRRLICICNSASSGTVNLFEIGLSSAASTVFAQAADGTTGSTAPTTTTFAINTWNHACGVFTSATSRASFLNGGGKGTSAVSRIPAGVNRTSIGLTDNTAPGAAMDSGASIGEGAIWNVALSDADVASLALGIHPFLVRPDALVAYWPLIGAYSPEINLKSNVAVQTMQGTLTQSAHPRVFYPSQRFIPRVGNTTMLGQTAM